MVVRNIALSIKAAVLVFFYSYNVMASDEYGEQNKGQGAVDYQSDHVESHQEKAINITDSRLNTDWRFVQNLRSTERKYQRVELPGKSVNRTPPLLYQPSGNMDGYRLISGVMDFKNSTNGAILLSGDGIVVHSWELHEKNIEWRRSVDKPSVVHGLHLLPDGSIVFNFNYGESLQRVDWCGRRIWATKGDYHHPINVDDNNTLWVWMGHEAIDYSTSLYLDQVDLSTGQVTKSIKFSDVMGANPDIDILGVLQNGYGEVDQYGRPEWLGDMWHANDAEPLRGDIAESFPDFRSGDLLISLMSLNLLFVLDPDDLKIKWWRSGVTRRQNDPDWQPSGRISVYDNNWNRRYSRITEIDPTSFFWKNIFDGKREDFYSRHGGTHQILKNGHVLITIPQQGRVIEVNPDGETVFEFINSIDSETNLVAYLTNAVFFDKDYIDLSGMPLCEK